MPIRDLDTDQKLAATSTGAEVVVSAGAGSGKTSLLVGRYLHQVMANAVPLHEIAAITFTNKAADQMKARIARRAPELVRNYPEYAELWTGLAERLHTAPISTIHAFCNSILRAYPLEAGVDPLFEVLDETTLAGLRSEAWRQFLDMRLDDDPDGYGMLIRSLGVSGLRRIMMDLMDRRSRVIIYLDTHGVPAPEELEERSRAFILRTLERYRDLLRSFHAVRPGDDAFSPSIEAFLFEWEEVVRAFENGDPECPAIGRIREIAREGTRRGSKDKWEAAGKPLAVVKCGVKECLAFLGIVESWRTQEKGITAETAARLLGEFVRFERFFLDLKKSRSCLDNDDSLIETWRLLRRSPTVCRKVSGSYRHILVDEFQDTDDLQLDILRMITGNSSACLFTVGDPKQSIYRFRGADVTVFNRFAARPGVDFKALRINYRSRPAVIAFVNHAFSRILGADDPEFLFEARYAEMKPFRKDPDDTPAVEIAVFETNGADERRAREGTHIARRARELNKRGCAFGRMALLLRKGTQARRYEEAFLREKIPFVNLAGGDPFGGPEAHDIANLLGWLSEPEDQALFTGTLFSPFFRADADFLYTLRQMAGKHGSLSETFLRADLSAPEWAGTDMTAIRGTLRELLLLRDRCSIRELLERAFEETGYTLALLADPIRGEESLAVLDLLLGAADTFESGGGSLAEFARLLRDGELASDRPPSIETHEDALTIITIHKSKGMEYEVVFLADASGRPKNDSPSWLLHDELGPGFILRGASGRMVKTLALSLAAETEKRKALAESKRLFYVACTRAKNHLVITGGRPSKTPDRGFEKDSWMGWLFDAFDVPRAGEDIPACPGRLCSWELFSDGGSTERADLTGHWRRLLDSTPEDDASERPDLSRFSSPALTVSGKPATLSPTQAEDYLACPALYSYRWVHRLDLTAEKDLSDGLGARYGDLAHHVLEQWDYRDRGRLVASVDDFAPGDIPASDRERLRKSLARFSESPLCRTLAEADDLRREESFAFLADDVLIRGKIDLAVRIGDRWMIVDYKTNNLRAEDTARAAERYRFQTGVYALALSRAEQVIPERLIVHFLTPGVSREFPCGKEFLDEVAGMLARMIGSLDAGDFRPRPSERCGKCPYRRLCEGVRK